MNDIIAVHRRDLVAGVQEAVAPLVAENKALAAEVERQKAIVVDMRRLNAGVIHARDEAETQVTDLRMKLGFRDAHIESLQNKWASRPLSREDQAKRIAALEAAILRLSVKCNGETGCPGYQLSYDLGLCPPRSTEETPEAMHARIVTETADAIASQMETACEFGDALKEFEGGTGPLSPQADRGTKHGQT